LFTGLRLGELLALEIADVDPKTQTVEIKRNLIRVSTDAISINDPNIRILKYNPEKKTHLVVQEFPKTERSVRTLPITDDLFELIIRHLFYLEQSNWPNPQNLLFPSAIGTYIDPRSYDKRLEAISARCGIKKVNPHALRRTFATRLIEQNVSIMTVMELMGHASVSTTQKYVEVMKEEKRKAVESLAEYLNPERLISGKRLNGAKKRMKFEDVRLPSWLQNELVME
jgi:integrase